MRRIWRVSSYHAAPVLSLLGAISLLASALSLPYSDGGGNFATVALLCVGSIWFALSLIASLVVVLFGDDEVSAAPVAPEAAPAAPETEPAPEFENDDAAECIICLGDGKTNEALRKTSCCGTPIHQTCVTAWLAYNDNGSVRGGVRGGVRDDNSGGGGGGGGDRRIPCVHCRV